MSVFEVIDGCEGPCLVLDDTRIAGPKPWGGGKVSLRFETLESYVPERTCSVEETCFDELWQEKYTRLSCGHYVWGYAQKYCPECGARIVSSTLNAITYTPTETANHARKSYAVACARPN